MKPGLILFILFIVVPVIEIGLFISIGGVIGVIPTLILIVLTAIAGSFLLRLQGLSVLNNIRTKINAGESPGPELGHGAMLIFAGALLLTPGFFTDSVGFLLFLPAFRKLVWKVLLKIFSNNISTMSSKTGGPYGPSGTGNPYRNRDEGVIDLDEDEWERKK